MGVPTLADGSLWREPTDPGSVSAQGRGWFCVVTTMPSIRKSDAVFSNGVQPSWTNSYLMKAADGAMMSSDAMPICGLVWVGLLVTVRPFFIYALVRLHLSRNNFIQTHIANLDIRRALRYPYQIVAPDGRPIEARCASGSFLTAFQSGVTGSRPH